MDAIRTTRASGEGVAATCRRLVVHAQPCGRRRKANTEFGPMT